MLTDTPTHILELLDTAESTWKSGNGYRSMLVSFEVNSLIVVVADSMRVILIWLTWGAEMVQRLTCQCSFILLEQRSNYCYDQIHQRTVPYEVGETWREIARYRWKRLTNRLDTVISFIEVKWEFQKAQQSPKKSYTMTQSHGLLSFFAGWRGSCFVFVSLVCWVCRNERTIFMKSRSTFWDVLAEVSKKSQPYWRAKCAPSALETSRSRVLSHWLPTSMNMGLPLLTLRTDWRKFSILSKDALESTE